MKTMIGAIALTLAVPAFAQTAPAADPHAQHKDMDHSQHGQAKHDCKACCERMKGKDGKMEKKAEAKQASPDASVQGHSGH
jgi:hypothetical protein